MTWLHLLGLWVKLGLCTIMFFNSDLLCKICFNSGSFGSLPSGVCQGEPVPELPDLGFLRLGNYPIAHRVYDALFPALLKVLVDGGSVSVGALGYLCQGQPEGFLVEVVGPGSLGGHGDHLGPASVEGPAAVGVGPGRGSRPCCRSTGRCRRRISGGWRGAWVNPLEPYAQVVVTCRYGQSFLGALQLIVGLG